MQVPSGYCIDASSAISLHRHYHRSRLEDLWALLEQVSGQGRLFAPSEVFRELKKRDDDALKWVTKHVAKVPLDNEQANALRIVQRTFPELDPASRTDPWADPLVVALALARTKSGQDVVVLTEEKDTTTRSTKIPYVCRSFSVRWARILDAADLEGLRFQLTQK